jgi:hypothetical protein
LDPGLRRDDEPALGTPEGFLLGQVESFSSSHILMSDWQGTSRAFATVFRCRDLDATALLFVTAQPFASRMVKSAIDGG